ncbi:MAG: hypothetical protein IJ915_08985 [Paludibacteraceae bacterium]|nr:hypothetical protein [Paludibacteraceae bacterium]
MKRIKSLCVFVLLAALCSCHSDNKAKNENQLLFAAEVDESEEDDVRIVSSPDGTICVYSRNNTSRDASYGWSVIYDVRDMDSVYTYEGLPDWEGEASSICKIYALPHPKRNLYLFDAFSRISGAYGYQAFVIYERKGRDLKRVPLLRDENGEMTSEIGFEYNFGDYYFRFANALSYDYQSLWDEEECILYYPLLYKDSYLLNDKFIKYRWDGKCLYPTTDTVANPQLYEPLRDYAACLQHTKAGYVQVRIDSLYDGRLRYTAWDRVADVWDEPNIVLYGERKGNEFHFYNQTYTYVVTQESTPEVRIYYCTTPGQLGELYSTYKED